MTNLEWALACAARKWLVFPSEGKRPLVRWSVSATLDPDTITEWYTRWPEADVCIKTGVGSNLVVVDWDVYKAGEDAVWPLGSPPDTYTAYTPKGGIHWYFTHPGYPVANSAGALAEYVDVRGDGGMVVAYQEVQPRPLRPIPEEWAAKRVSPLVDPNVSLEPVNPFVPSKNHAWANNLYKLALAEIRGAPEGKRNFILYAQASDVYRLVWGGRLDKDTVTNEMAQTAYENGMEPQEIAATLTSAMRNAASKYGKDNA